MNTGFKRLLALMLTLTTSVPAMAADYDLVIQNGRVMNSETSDDKVADMGVRGGKIATVRTGTLKGDRFIDATGHVVSRGFIAQLAIAIHDRGEFKGKTATYPSLANSALIASWSSLLEDSSRHSEWLSGAGNPRSRVVQVLRPGRRVDGPAMLK